VIMPPIIGTAMRCVTSAPCPFRPHDRREACQDNRYSHRFRAHALKRTFVDRFEERFDGCPRAARDPAFERLLEVHCITNSNSAATPASAMKPTALATERLWRSIHTYQKPTTAANGNVIINNAASSRHRNAR
jgi:hypothetical protein